MSQRSLNVNGEPRVLAARVVEELLNELGMADRAGIAIAVNGAVVRRRDWAEHALAAGDRVEIVAAVQGG